MLIFAYLVLFLALSAALTWWRVINYQRRFELAPHAQSQRNAARSELRGDKRKLNQES